MSCQRTREIDLPDYLADPRDARWVAFRAHFVECDDCAVELARWARLEDILREGPPMAIEHPEPEMLLSYAETPDTLSSEERERTAGHLESCPACRTDLAALAGFDFSAAARLSEEAASEYDRQQTEQTDREGAAGLLGWLTTLLTGPRLAIAVGAVAAALLFIATSGTDRSGETTEDPGPRFVQEDLQTPAPVDDATAGTPEQYAEAPPSTPTETPPAFAQPTPSASPDVPHALPLQLAEAPTPTPLAAEPIEAPTPVLPRRSEPVEATPEPSEREREVMLIAAYDALGRPDYLVPDPTDGLPFDRPRRTWTSRSSSEASVGIRALSPEHVGRTISASPTLWWHLSADTKAPIRFQLVQADAIDPALELELEGAKAAGFHEIDLAEFGVELSPGALYEWSISVEIEPGRPLRNPRSFGAVVRAPSDAIDAAPTDATRAHSLAGAGIWYDAFDELARRSRTHPEVAGLAAQRDALLEEAGLGKLGD